MINHANIVATKGILSKIPTAKYLIFGIEQGPITPEQKVIYARTLDGGAVEIEEKLKKVKKYVKVTFEFEGKKYEQTEYINDDVEVTMDNIEIFLNESQEPKIRVIFEEI